MMGIVVPETCWAYKKYNNIIINGIYLVFILQNIRIVRRGDQTVELHSAIFNELKIKKKQLPSQCFCKEKNNNEMYGNIVV